MKFLKQVNYMGPVIGELSCQNQHAYFLRFPFMDDFLKIKKDLELVFRPYILQTFLIKNLILFLFHSYDVIKFKIENYIKTNKN